MPKGVYPRTEYHRKISSTGHKGQNAWNKGKKCPETSARFKGKGNPQFGVVHAKEYCDHMSNILKGKNNYNWKGGIKTEPEGYRLTYSPNHPFARKHGRNKRIYVAEHRLMVEKHIGRYLKPEEVVHHINGIKNDNRIKNLMLFNSQRAHRKYEHIIEGIKEGEIIFDGHTIPL